MIQLISVNNKFGTYSIRQGASIGRAEDNTIVIRHIAVTRFHARINRRDLDIWVTDLQSRNGTYVNNRRIYEPTRIEHGDLIGFGNTDDCQFRVILRYDTPNMTDSPTSSIQKITGLGICTGILFGVGYGAYQMIGTKPQPIVKITQPFPGSTISQTTPVTIEATNPEDIMVVVYKVDSIEITRSPEPPFMAYLDPKLIKEITGTNHTTHTLSVSLELKDGTQLEQLSPTQILIEQPATPEKKQPIYPESNPKQRTIPSQPNPWYSPTDLDLPTQPATGLGQYPEKRDLKNKLLHKLGSQDYTIGEPLDYSIDTVLKSERKDSFYLNDTERKAILTACTRRGVKPEIALILAESQSESGTWKIPGVVWKKYNFENTTPDNQLNQVTQYIKDLLNCFDEEDWVYAIACYGADIQTAGVFRQRLETYDVQKVHRKNISQTLNSGIFPPAAIENVKKFIVNGVQLEFPNQFGIQSASLSSQLQPR